MERLGLIRDEANKLLPDGYEANLYSAESITDRVVVIAILCHRSKDRYVLDCVQGGWYYVRDMVNILVQGNDLEDVLFRFTTKHRIGAL